MTGDADSMAPAAARALIESAGLVRCDTLASFRVTGADAIDYLHRMTTQDIASLAPGGATYACVLTPKGRILGDFLVWRPGVEVVLDGERAAFDSALPTLEKFVIMDDVAFEDVTAGRARYVLAGPAAPTALVQAGLEVPAPGAVVECEVGGLPAWNVRFDRGTQVRYELSVAPGAGASLEERLTAVPEVSLCDGEAHEAARVHHGIPAFGRELTDEVLFNEAGLESAVSWNKGCYPGQEPVVMAKRPRPAARSPARARRSGA
jgi:folate-binding protein YgfZ